jgi:hypothetical protein
MRWMSVALSQVAWEGVSFIRRQQIGLRAASTASNVPA